MVTKELLKSILIFSEENQIPEKQAAIHFDINPKTLHYYKKKFGIEVNPKGNGKFTHRHKRQNSVNDDFFEVPNELNCYWAGFIAADGCIHTGKKQDVLSIFLALKDKNHLNRFKLDIDFDGQINEGVINEMIKNFNIVIFLSHHKKYLMI